MSKFIAFTKKEILGLHRTYKILILVVVFLAFGFMNPLTAKITPYLMENLMPEGLNINIGNPTALDSWAQFYKNIPQLGLIVLTIVFSTILTGEYSKGTLINMVTKGLSRKIVIISKFITTTLVWTASYWLCFFVTHLYTLYYWTNNLHNLFFAAFCLWLFGVLIISTIILASVIFNKSYSVLLSVAAFAGALALLNIPKKIKQFNPLLLSSSTNILKLLENIHSPSYFIWAIIIASVLTIAFLILSILLFNKKQL